MNSSNDKLRIGIIGAGRMGRFHAAGYIAAGAVVAAVYDDFRDNADMLAKEFSATAADSLQDLIDNYELHAVSICTPPVAHEAACVAAMKAGIAVLCEKPLAADLDQCRRTVAAQQQYDGRLMVAFFNRYFEPIVRLREEYAKNRQTWGDVSAVNVIFDLGRQPTKPWLWDRAIAGGGALVNNGVHALDLIRLFCGELDGGYVMVRDGDHTQGLDTDAWGLVGTKSGAVASFRTRTSSVERVFSFEIEFAKARAVASWYPPSLVLTEEGKTTVSVPLVSSDPLDRIQSAVAAFVEAVRFGDFSRLPGALDGARAYEAAGRLYESAEKRQFASLESSIS